MTPDQHLYFIALTRIPKVGPILGKTLISYCGSAQEVFAQSKKKLLKIPGIGPSFFESFDPKTHLQEAEKEYEFALKNNLRILTFMDEDYPKRLNHIEASPLVLFFKGKTNLNHARTVAIVGTRQPTDYGKMMCEKVVEGLLPYDVLIVSGLAFGIDVASHRKCVELQIPTIGVLGHGLDRIYPSAHAALSKKMIENGGLLTEFPSGTDPDRENFPMRNRIIAALSDVVVVIESKKKGGSIITAEFANDYNKDVFAVPGAVNQVNSEGCNRLIKQNKAHLIESAADISYIMRWDEIDAQQVIQKQLFVDVTDEENNVLALIKGKGEITIDVLTFQMKSTSSEIAALLLSLEFKGLVRCLPGKKFVLT